jgi:hypothetical protein
MHRCGGCRTEASTSVHEDASPSVVALRLLVLDLLPAEAAHDVVVEHRTRDH